MLSSALAVQAVGAMGGGVEHWLQASEAELVAHAATTPTPPARAGAPHLVKRAADGMFYLAGSANDAPIRFLIDTGSSTTILTRSDAARLGLAERGNEGSRRARTLAGDVRITQARVKELRIAGKRFADVKIGVASDDLGVSLIGQDVLSRFDSITIERDRASLR
ncbi:retroviral-like aspartic protease family protein [Sphingomonas sp. JC676]|uniref:retropepsin-like aspartic protease family protein n=1 Tax=Sphingomonas sp. JC676 TaxID=2768065 RepID=UPI001657940B|nr:retropepsin-like aspartic protease [Sphingomonas sp. JC676]MBC9033078.1 retroviral-like aspartic protease family protein [Sphingomonas sp. JC676]